MVSFSLLGLQHPEPNGSRRATPTSTFQHRPGHLLSTAGEWFRRYRDNGETTARKQGQPPGSKLDDHEAFILGLVEETPDISLGEIAERLLAERSVSAVPSTVWEFFDKRNITFKKDRACKRTATRGRESGA